MENAKKSFVPGYIIGGSIFLIILPTIFYIVSQKIDSYFNILIIGNNVVQLFISFILLTIGLIFSFGSIIIQYKIGKGGPFEGYKIGVSPKTKKLNTTGVYKYTRNPMLFGTCTLYFSLAFFLNSLSLIILTALFSISMIIIVKTTEEKRLLADFGKEYKAYKEKTSMFIPLPPY